MSDTTIVLFGGSGLAGYAIKNHLATSYTVYAPTRQECNLLIKESIDVYLSTRKPSIVINCAGLVGGILYNNTESFSFLKQNLDIGINVATSCFENAIPNYIYFGSNCIYPKDARIPIDENQILAGKLESTNRSYALSKLVSIQLIDSINKKFGTNYFAIMPPNLYGDNDFFDLNKSHVLQSLMLKIHLAKINNEKTSVIWGSGKPKREFLHTSDLARGVEVLLHQLHNVTDLISGNDLPIINIGNQSDLTISELASMLAEEIDWRGTFIYDDSKPDGTHRKLLDSSLIYSLGWRPEITLSQGINSSYCNFLAGRFRS